MTEHTTTEIDDTRTDNDPEPVAIDYLDLCERLSEETDNDHYWKPHEQTQLDLTGYTLHRLKHFDLLEDFTAYISKPTTVTLAEKGAKILNFYHHEQEKAEIAIEEKHFGYLKAAADDYWSDTVRPTLLAEKEAAERRGCEAEARAMARAEDGGNRAPDSHLLDAEYAADRDDHADEQLSDDDETAPNGVPDFVSDVTRQKFVCDVIRAFGDDTLHANDLLDQCGEIGFTESQLVETLDQLKARGRVERVGLADYRIIVGASQ